MAIFAVALLSVGYIAAKRYLRPMEFMSLKKVCLRWGDQPFDEAKFKDSGEKRSIRAKMACSLLKNQEKYIGMNNYKIKEILGPPSGRFFNEMFPTYLINKAEKLGEDVWQLLFWIDSNRKISKIVVHKNCCYH